MTEATPESGAQPSSSSSTLGIVFVAVAALASILYVTNAFGIRGGGGADVMNMTMGEGTARCSVSGKVTDASGKPAVNATVMCEWVVESDNGQTYNGMIVRQTDASGNYEGTGEFNSEMLVKAKRITMNCKLRACPDRRDALPSEPVLWTDGAISDKKQDLQLGAALPTVPLHVVDTAGKPVEKIWAKALRVDKPRDDLFEPRREGRFSDGIMPLAVPLDRFKVKVHLKGTGRTTIVGPFDPKALPDHIDVTLPDR